MLKAELEKENERLKNRISELEEQIYKLKEPTTEKKVDIELIYDDLESDINKCMSNAKKRILLAIAK